VVCDAFNYKLGERARSGENDYRYFKITAYDAVKEGILKLEEVEQAKRDLPENVFNELYLAEPADDKTNPFGIDNIRRCYRPVSRGTVVAWGIDLAKYSDYTVIVGLDANNQCAYVDRFQADWGITQDRIIRLIGNTPAFIDSALVWVILSLSKSKGYVKESRDSSSHHNPSNNS
jgi:hypothetical protein